MANKFNFSSDQINVFMMLIDESGSMEHDAGNVRRGLQSYKKSFEGFPEANSIAISKSTFDETVRLNDFCSLQEFNTDYHSGGGTALYFSIMHGAAHLSSYMREVTVRTGCTPRGTFIVFSDGMPCGDPGNPEAAKKAILDLNLAGVTTVFVAFGNAISSNFGKDLGFVSTIDVNDRNTLVNFLGVELSQSCKEQSRSLKALGADFFSKAADKSSSAGYSATTAQALEDDDWLSSI